MTDLGNDRKFIKFTLATEEFFMNRNHEKVVRVEWHDIVAWKKLAENIQKLVHKGDLIYVEGKIRNKNWTDSNNIKRYAYEIEIFEFQRLSKKSEIQTAVPDVDQNTGEILENTQGNTENPETDDLPF